MMNNHHPLQIGNSNYRFYTYSGLIHSYILDYRKEYDPESLKGTEYEYLLHDDSSELVI